MHMSKHAHTTHTLIKNGNMLYQTSKFVLQQLKQYILNSGMDKPKEENRSETRGSTDHNMIVGPQVVKLEYIK